MELDIAFALFDISHFVGTSRFGAGQVAVTLIEGLEARTSCALKSSRRQRRLMVTKRVE
jgi:hypothetical protein